MKFDFEFACDQLNSTNQSLLLEVSSSASCQHLLTMCIRSCTYSRVLCTSRGENNRGGGLEMVRYNNNRGGCNNRGGVLGEIENSPFLR